MARDLQEIADDLRELLDGQPESSGAFLLLLEAFEAGGYEALKVIEKIGENVGKAETE